MPSAPQRSPQREPFPRQLATTSPDLRAAEEAPRPLRDDIPDAVWKGFDSAIAPLRPKIRGAFNRYIGLLQTAFTIEQLEAALRRDGNLEAIVSSPDGEEMKRPAREELYDLYLGPRRLSRAEREAQGMVTYSRPDGTSVVSIHLRPLGPALFNAVRDAPAKAPVVTTMLATSKVAADTSAAIPRGWWNRQEMIDEMTTWAQLNAASRVTAVTDGTRAGIRQIVTSAFDFEDGTDRDGIARALRALDGTGGKVRLGLDAPRQKTFMKFIDDYPAIPAGTPASARRMLEIRRQKALDRRYRQLLKQRADTIARTEALTVGNHGQDQTRLKAVADGQLDLDAYILEWIARAIRVCPRCRAMDGGTREIMGGEFVSDGTGPRGVETAYLPDLHPRGFCVVREILRRHAIRPPGQPPLVPASPPETALPTVPRFKTVPEATAWMEENLFDAVDLPKVKLSTLQDIADGTDAVIQRRFKIEVLQYQQKRQRFYASYSSSLSGDVMQFQKTFTANFGKRIKEQAGIFERNQARLIARWERTLANPKVPKALKDDATRRLNIARRTFRWSTPEDAARPMFSVAAHEAGHALDFQATTAAYRGQRMPVGRAWTKLLRDWLKGDPTRVSEIAKISEYAASNDRELWAELTSLIADGRTNQAHPDLLEMYRNVMATWELKE